MNMPDYFRYLNDLGFQSYLFGLSFLWQSTVLLVAVFGISRFYRHRSAKLLHVVWLLAFAAAPVIPVVSLMASSMGTPQMTIRVMPSHDAYRAEMDRLWQQYLASFGTGGYHGNAAHSVTPVSVPENTRVISHSVQSSGSSSILLSPWAWGMLFYLGAVFFILARIAAGWFSLRRWTKNGRIITEPQILDLFRATASRLSLRRHFIVLTSSNVAAPLTVGVIHPIILLPVDLAKPQALPDLRAIALHELAHIRRYDTFSLLIVSVLRAIFFFHPLFWIASRKISLLTEIACDDAVLETTGEPLTYAKTLARFAERVPKGRFPLNTAACLFPYRSIFIQRIESILSERRTLINSSSRWTVAGILASYVFVFTLACSIPLGERRFAMNRDHPIMEKTEFSQHAAAFAAPLDGITIDGRIDDWPKNIIRYPIRNHGKAYGPSDIDTADLDTSPDLSPEMMVGFNPKDNLLYIAVMVRDDSVYVERNPVNRNCFMSDACEVYVDGAHVLKQVPVGGRERHPVRQYVMCPEGGAYSNFISAPDSSANPNLVDGDISKTRTKCVAVRHGNTTIYEWAVELYDNYPDRKTILQAGKTVGFDIAVVDRDNDGIPVNNPAGGSTAWVCWAQFGTLKAFDTDLLGDLVLMENQKGLGMIRGQVASEESGKPCENLDIDVFRDGKPAGRVKTGLSGKYEFPARSGMYTLKPHPGQDIRNLVPETVEISAGKRVNVKLAAAIH